MKVQTKITLLLVLVVAAFMAGLWSFRLYDRAKFRRVTQERFDERNRSFEDFLEYHGEALQTLAEYDTSWDQMFQAVEKNDQAWLTSNVNAATLEGYRANAIWIFRPDGSLIHSVNSWNSAELAKIIPLPPDAFPPVFGHDQFPHFFIRTPSGTSLRVVLGDSVNPTWIDWLLGLPPGWVEGVMEIRGAPIQDSRRQTTPNGYFFAGRLWNGPTLREMSIFTGNYVSIIPPEHAASFVRKDSQDGTIAFTRPLNGWDGKPIAYLAIQNESPVVQDLNRSSNRLLLSLFAFAIILWLLISSSLVRWVSRPLHRIMESLTRNDAKPIAPLRNDNSEFGELARTVNQFFQQRDNLIREMEERRATEEALRKSEDELRHSQKMEAVGRLAGGVAHDFNNLLTAIIGYADLIAARPKLNPVVKQNADLIRKAGEQAATLTRQLLAFSRKQLLQPKVIDLNELIVDMQKLLRRVIGERFDLQAHPDAKIGRVKADPSQIEQVVLNLGVNARDAMPTGGTLIIGTGNIHLDQATAPQIATSLVPGDYVVLSVTDTGAGMDEETKRHIFEPFFTTKGPGKGTGLGLATVYGIVRQTGGGISVESKPGEGSTFRIYLPLEMGPVEHTKPVAPRMDKSRNFETVLVVEDEEIVRDLVCEVLVEQGYNVLCSADGVEALEVASQYDGQIHLLITDVIMPHMNGQELAVKLSALRPDMKVLYVSGYSDNDIGDHGVLDPRIELLQKPFTPETLARKIRDVIRDGAYAEVAGK